ncbi:MAG: glycine cleavage system protein H [Verrucomicrobiales bacterium]|jgi:glycine cleavage system H protein|nr:glycine cleavage system protein H [Verrucomicrobiales bacterium]MBP9224515.1 glycine cleavage system protein H [Verrucomicrobiales bacterium]HQZ28748.1 glycine cleavage system protein H [Verrucomicrobiales bacterium]
MEFARYKHARFSARLPVDFRYSLSHYWMSEEETGSGLWKVGFTKFATRMLGELVEAQFEVKAGDPVASGDQIGYVEGFKAASDLFCVMDGAFVSGNPILEVDACIVKSSPYVDGWLYSVAGAPEESSVDVYGYIEHLGALIEKMQQEGY